MNITVYIPCYNAEKFISDCLGAVFAQSIPPVEVIIVNDGSTDRTVEMAGEFPVTVLDLPAHPGLAAARNTAVRAAAGDFVASLDADCIADAFWLERLLETMADDAVAGAGGMLVEAHQDRLADRWRAVHMRQNWGNRRVLNPPFLFGCNNLFRKSALEGVGLYDTRFTTNGEDVDISRRIREAGWDLVYEPAAVASHLKRDTVTSALKADWKWGYLTTGDTAKFRNSSNIVYHNFTNSRYRMSRDIRSHNYRLLPLDLLLLLCHTYWDLSHARRIGLLDGFSPRPGQRIDTLTGFDEHLARLARDRFLKNPDCRAEETDRKEAGEMAAARPTEPI